MYLALEGVDTAGKSTQISLLKERFPRAIFTKEPGGTSLGKNLREILLHGEGISARAEMLLFLADRAEHAERVLKKHEESLIISDRSLISGIAYARGFELSWLKEANLFATGGIVPSLVVFLELSESELRRRIAQKEQDSIESRGVGYLMELQTRIKLAIEELRIPALILDASKAPSEICDAICTRIHA